MLNLTIQYQGLQFKEKMRRERNSLPGRECVQRLGGETPRPALSNESSGSVAADQGESWHKNKNYAPSPVIRCD
jgi:arginine/lysine/ornithine decarboxylase